MLEGDTGWHIRAGEWILQNGRVPDTDIFSFTKAGQPWFAWEWLWDVLFAMLHQLGGMAAVVFVSLLLLCFTSALLFRLVRRSCANVFIAFGVTWMAVAASSIHWLARPHIFTMLFTVVFLWVLDRSRSGKSGYLWSLPVVMLAWVNLHGGFMIGLFLVSAWCAGQLLNAALEPSPVLRREALHRAARYGMIAAACCVATFANPYFYRLHGHILFTLTDPESPLYRFVAEWQPLSLRAPLTWYVEPIILVTVGAVVWHLFHRRFADALVLIALLHSAFIAFRNLPIFMLAAAPSAAAVLAYALDEVSNSALPRWLRNAVAGFTDAAADFAEMDRHWRLHIVSFVVIAALGAAMFGSSPAETMRADYDKTRYPVAAVDKLGSLLSRSVFTDDEWGDYLIYRFYPAGKVFVDGRFDLYGGKFTAEYLDILNGQHQWDSSLKQYSVNTVLLSVKAPLTGVLKESPRWSVVYDDGVAIVFRSRRSTDADRMKSVASGAAGRLRDIPETTFAMVSRN